MIETVAHIGGALMDHERVEQMPPIGRQKQGVYRLN